MAVGFRRDEVQPTFHLAACTGTTRQHECGAFAWANGRCDPQSLVPTSAVSRMQSATKGRAERLAYPGLQVTTRRVKVTTRPRIGTAWSNGVASQ